MLDHKVAQLAIQSPVLVQNRKRNQRLEPALVPRLGSEQVRVQMSTFQFENAHPLYPQGARLDLGVLIRASAERPMIRLRQDLSFQQSRLQVAAFDRKLCQVPEAV